MHAALHRTGVLPGVSGLLTFIAVLWKLLGAGRQRALPRPSRLNAALAAVSLCTHRRRPF